MARSADTTMRQARALRGAGGLRGVHARTASRSRGSRASSGRGPSPRDRWQRPGSSAPRAVDRVESLQVAGLTAPLPALLVGTASRTALPVIIGWGAGGSTVPDLTTDASWARELADETGAIVVLCGSARAGSGDGDAVAADAAASFSDVAARAATLGLDASAIAVTGRGAGFRIAARVAAEAAAWPALPTPAACVAVAPLTAAAAALRESLGLQAPPRPLRPLRPGTEVRTADGMLLGRVGEVRGGDFEVYRGLTAAELLVPLRAVRRVQGAVTLGVSGAELALRDWGRAAADATRRPDASRN